MINHIKDLREYRWQNHNWTGVRRCKRCEDVLTIHHKPKETNDYCNHCFKALQ